MGTLAEAKLTLVESTEEINSFLSWLGERRPILAVDTETTGLSLAKDKLRLVQFGDGEQGWALPYRDWRGVVREVFARYDGPIVLQHAKFDAGMLERDGIPFPWERVHDTMIMCFLHDSLGPKGLKAAAARYVDPMAGAGERELKAMMMKNRWDYATVPIDLPAYWGYSALDTVLTARLAEALWPAIQPYREAYDLELACEHVLADLELRGTAIDVPYCNEMIAALQEELDGVVAGLGGINPGSAAQVILALQAAGAVLTKRTEKGALSVDDEALRGVNHPIAGSVLAARHLTKIISSYFENFIAYEQNGILHPHINQLAARTGRMSVTEPALQTLPRTSLVRDAFIPREGNSLVLIDYDNEELRMAAHFSQDPTLMRVLREGADLHDQNAERLYGSEFTREQRGTAKNSMYAWLYGAGDSKFAYAAHVPLYEGMRVKQMLQETYPAVAATMQRVSRGVVERAGGGEFGWVRATDGRHLRVRADKAYIGLNALIQGSCAVALKQSLVDLAAAGFSRYCVLPVHDELLFDVPSDEVNDVVPEIVKIMTRNEYTVPLTVGTKVVSRWGDPYRKEEES